MPTLDDAIALAARAHYGQRDRAGDPYILHPIRVMLHFEDELRQTIAVLHDVIEDSEITPDDLRQQGYSEEIVSAVDHLSRRQDESYEEFVERACQNPLARCVKLADLDDNMNIRRLPSLGPKDAERIQRYHRAWVRLTGSETD